MRRERKNQLRKMYVDDALARWKAGDPVISSMKSFETAVTADESDMKQFSVALEEAIIDYMKASFNVARTLKPGTLRTLCQKYADTSSRRWNKTVFMDAGRLEAFESICAEWILHYETLIVETAVAFYMDLLATGRSYKSIQRRILKSLDVYYIWNGEEYIMEHLDSRISNLFALRSGHVKGELQLFVEDKQNIHTGEINTQTKDTLKIILAAAVPEGQKTMAEIEASWTSFQKSEKTPVLLDMRTWASKSLVVDKDDYLYRNLLRHLWAKIKSYPADIRTELVKRLYEECHDALQMCAQGHVARLANVLIGFDDAVKPTVSLQDKMAELSRADLSVEEKKAAAAAILDEFRVEDRAAWLEALDA